MQQGAIIGAMSDAANNANGAANGFMGVGMMNMAAGTGMIGNVTSNAFSAQGASSTTSTPIDPYAKTDVNNSAKVCPNCGKNVFGKFCSECGTLVTGVKKCSNCGMEVTGKFCGNCGTQVQ